MVASIPILQLFNIQEMKMNIKVQAMGIESMDSVPIKGHCLPF